MSKTQFQCLRTISFAALVGLLSACSDSSDSQVDTAASVQETPVVGANIENLTGGEPLDQVQVALDQVITEGISQRLQNPSAVALVDGVSAVILQLIEVPDELLESVIISGDLLRSGSLEPDGVRLLLADSSEEMRLHLSEALTGLLRTLQAAGSEATDVVNAQAVLTRLIAALQPRSEKQLSHTQIQSLLSEAAGALAALDSTDFGFLGADASASNLVMGLVAQALTTVGDLLEGLREGSAGELVDALLTPITALVDAVLMAVPGMEQVMNRLAEESGLEPPVGGLFALIDALGEADDNPGISSTFTYVFDLVGSLLDPVNPLLCQLLPIIECGE